jgi:23S rRNA (cytidine1920-2'-O)/16S rRNA (cytidine1409-2'-O)-methyltransferase
VAKRIDEVIVERGLLPSRTLAKSFILEGKVLVNGEAVLKASSIVGEADKIEILEPRRFVSRGGVKLEFALNFFAVDVNNKIALDVGASTGGFTDCLLKRGSSRVYSVDVGTGQLDYSLRNDQRVVVLENTNARYLSKEKVSTYVDIVVMDVSFISIIKILPALNGVIKDDSKIISLIKPQFEGEQKFTRKGIVRNPDFHKTILRSLASKIAELNYVVTNATYSPIRGVKGNIEFFFQIEKQGSLVNLSLIDKIVNEAWEKTK